MNEKLISLEEAFALIDRNVERIISCETVPLELATGRVLASDIIAEDTVPCYDSSAMDGFAVDSGTYNEIFEREGQVELEIIESIPAGKLPLKKIGKGQAARIMTGAPLPEGADAILIKEKTRESLRGKDFVTGLAKVKAGIHIRKAGTDFKKGDRILTGGSRIFPATVGLLASAGYSKVEVTEKPRVGFLSTGDEVLGIDSPLSPGKVRDSNRYMLASLVEDAGGVPVYAGHVPDELEKAQELLKRAFQECDVLITTGGVSVGDYDFMKEAVESAGVKKIFWQVGIRPGKPTYFGLLERESSGDGYAAETTACGKMVEEKKSSLARRRVNKKLYFGLPGNPASAFVTFTLFVRRSLEILSTGKAGGLFPLRAMLEKEIKAGGDRVSYLRGDIRSGKGRLSVLPADLQDSNVLSRVAASSVLIEVPAGEGFIPAGSEVTVYPIRRLDW